MNKQEVFLLYVGDTWLDECSMRLLAVCSCEEKAIEFAEQDADENEEPLCEEDLSLLKNQRQTQGRENNYMITRVNVDEL